MQTPLVMMSKPALIMRRYSIIEFLSPLRIFIKGIWPLPHRTPFKLWRNLAGQQLTMPYSCNNVPEFSKSSYFGAGVPPPHGARRWKSRTWVTLGYEAEFNRRRGWFGPEIEAPQLFILSGFLSRAKGLDDASSISSSWDGVHSITPQINQSTKVISFKPQICNILRSP